MNDPNGNAGRIERIIERRPRLLLVLICLLAWLPGFFTIPPLDRDESRFAQASKQMLETGNFVDIRFGKEPRYKKPAGIYWLQAATTRLAGFATNGALDRIWTYRIPSLLGALVAVLLCFWCARAILGVQASFLAAVLLALTFLLSSEARIAKTDAVLLASVVGTQAVLFRTYLSRFGGFPAPSFGLVLLGWLALAVGILIKGPVIVGVAGITVVALVVWDREWRWLGRLRPLWGLGLSLLIVAPWLVAIAIMSHGTFYEQSLGHDFGAKLAHGEEGHGMYPGYYLLLTTLTFWPATLFLAPGVAAAIANRGQPGARFLLAWAGGWWLIELVPTKLPNYILPSYPALAIMAAAWIAAPGESNLPAWRRLMPAVSSAQFLAGGLATAAAIPVLPRLYGPGTTWAQAGCATLLAVLCAIAVLALLRKSGRLALSLAAGAAIGAYASATLLVLPNLDNLMVSSREAALVAKHERASDPPPTLAGYTEPSALFLIGTATQLTDGRGAAETGARRGGLALVADGERPAFLARLAELEADATAVDDLSGFNYSRGRKVHITVYRVTPAR
jgi:4-amino-4-deoxy-L-arabinose transferase-like glycosyltransferase